MWRPKNWNEIKNKEISSCSYIEEFSKSYFIAGLECGTDAILKELRNEGTHFSVKDIDLCDAPEESGYWVFIPDEEVDAKNTD